MTEGTQPTTDEKIKAVFLDRYQQRADTDLLRLQSFTAASSEKRTTLVHPDEYIPGVVSIAGGLFPESSQIHEILLAHLRQEGYEVEDLTTEEYRSRSSFSHAPPADEMRIHGWSTGFAKVTEEAMKTVGVCGSCEEYVSVRGIRMDGHACEKCGEVTFEELPKGSQVSLPLFDPPENPIGLRADETGELITAPLDPQVLRGWGSLVVESYDPESDLISCFGDLEQVKAEGLGYGSNAKEAYRRIADYGHFDRIVIHKSDISRIDGSRYNHRIAKLFQGKEYREWDRLPIAETFNIYEPWHWVPAVQSPELHNKILSGAMQVSDKGYYYQDGRTAFYDGQLEQMRRFVDHFTTLNLADWDNFVRRAPKSGPGFIDALAYFCSSNPHIIDEPNIGNFIVGLADRIEGKQRTPKQIASEIQYLMSEGFTGSVDDLIATMQDAGIIPTEEAIEKARQQRAWIQQIWDSLDTT